MKVKSSNKQTEKAKPQDLSPPPKKTTKIPQNLKIQPYNDGDVKGIWEIAGKAPNVSEKKISINIYQYEYLNKWIHRKNTMPNN